VALEPSVRELAASLRLARAELDAPSSICGKSDAPATRTCASACRTRSEAMAKSGFAASASSTSA
jgi:hypothetical protein